MGLRVKQVEKEDWTTRFFFFYIHWIIYFKFFQESCVGHADEKKKEKKEGTKRVRARITGRPGKLRHTPRCSGIHQVSPATTQSAKPLTIRILLLEKPLFDERSHSPPKLLALCFATVRECKVVPLLRSFVRSRQFSFVGGRDVSLLFWQIGETRVAS